MVPITSHLVVLASLVVKIHAVNNGLARTPQMGWNNWNSLGCDVSESLLLDTSRKLIDYGLRDIGYNYVVLDDCWSSGRGADRYLRVDMEKFPRGMKYIADTLHDSGLLYGMYSSAGELTCARYPGSLDFEREDAKSFASWNVDYLKYDNCYHKGRFGYPEVSFNRYNVMAEALNATGRPILYSLCNWGEDFVHTWGMSIANSWRVSGDIYDSFDRPDDLCPCTDMADPHCVAPGSHCSVMRIINRVAPYVDRGQPGGWNDLDMLEVGHGGMTAEEYQSHFSMWAALKSPLLIGTDLRHLDAAALRILNNPAVIAVNQDPLGRSAVRRARSFSVPKNRWGEGETQVWSGPLYPNDQLVLFLNAADENLEMSIPLSDVFVDDGPGGSAPQTRETWDLHDLWANAMDEDTAQHIIDAAPLGFSTSTTAHRWYNATEKPYAKGLQDGDKRLLGKKVGVVGPGAQTEIKAHVPRHGVRMFRLRCHNGYLKRYTVAKDEL